MKKNTISKRFPLSTALKEEYYQRMLLVREEGFSIPEIFVMGIESAEKKIKSSKK